MGSMKFFLRVSLYILLIFISACDERRAATIDRNNSAKNAIIADEDYQYESLVNSLEGVVVLSYGNEFAERSGFPMMESQDEYPQGLYAMELKVERNEEYFINRYSCELRLYMDSELGIAFPEVGRSGSLRMLAEKNFFIRTNERRSALDESDVVYIEENRSRYLMKVYFVIEDTEGNLLSRHSLNYMEFYKEILDGVDYAKVLFNCSFYTYLNSAREDLKFSIWVKKEVSDSAEAPDERAENYVRFSLHEEFVDKISVVMEEAYDKASKSNN